MFSLAEVRGDERLEGMPQGALAGGVAGLWRLRCSNAIVFWSAANSSG
jgi:hypothetical protein